MALGRHVMELDAYWFTVLKGLRDEDTLVSARGVAIMVGISVSLSALAW